MSCTVRGSRPLVLTCSAHVQTGIGEHPASCGMDRGLFPGVKRPGRSINHRPHLAPRIKKRVELYLTLIPFWGFMVSSRANCTLTFDVYRLFSTSNTTITLTRNINLGIKFIYNKNHLFTSSHCEMNEKKSFITF